MQLRQKGWIAAYGVAILVTFWLVFDVWIIQGQALDVVTREPVRDATILVSLYAKNIDVPYPHARVSSPRCLRTVVLKTDERGRYHSLQLTFSPLRMRSTAAMNVLKEGWYRDVTDRVTGRRTPFGRLFEHTFYLNPKDNERWSFPARRGESPQDYELTLSRELTAIVKIGSGGNVCTKEAWPLVNQALVYGMNNASTRAEVEFVRLRCRDAYNLTKLRKGDWRWPDSVDDDLLSKFPECRPLFKKR